MIDIVQTIARKALTAVRLEVGESTFLTKICSFWKAIYLTTSSSLRTTIQGAALISPNLNVGPRLHRRWVSNDQADSSKLSIARRRRHAHCRCARSPFGLSEPILDRYPNRLSSTMGEQPLHYFPAGGR